MRKPPTLEQAEQFMWDAQLHQRIDFAGPWQGWKMRGMWLVSPHGDRIKARELEYVMFRYRLRVRGPKREKAEVVALVASTPVVVDAPASSLRKAHGLARRR